MHNPTGEGYMSLKSMGEAQPQQYVYFFRGVALFRVKIPNFDRADNHNHELNIETVFYNPPHTFFPDFMGLFSVGHIVYLVGGREKEEYEGSFRKEFSRLMYVFDPTKSKIPVKDPLELLEKDFDSMVFPVVVRSKDNKIYFLYNFCFQSFDPTKNCFEPQPNPPWNSDGYRHRGLFILCDYIYLFVTSGSEGFFKEYAYTFNTRSSEWKLSTKLVDGFLDNKIPIPCAHRGDVGLSDDEFPGKTHIMVALSKGKPIAYRVRLDKEGSFYPISYRFLGECYIPPRGKRMGITYLAYIGGGRFCVMYSACDTHLLMYVFKFDFALEYQIQTNSSSSSSASTIQLSSEILSSKEFQLNRHEMPLLKGVSGVCSQFCLASAPPASHKRNDDKRKKQRDDDKKRMNRVFLLVACSFASALASFVVERKMKNIKGKEHGNY